MRFADMRAANADRTKKGTVRKKSRELLEAAAAQGIPPATPYREVTGVDENGFSRADHNGGAHWRGHLQAGRGNLMGMREIRRANRFGGHGEQPMRSRIQRQTRKRRTGGVK